MTEALDADSAADTTVDVTPEAPAEAAPKTSRAGRDLKAAIVGFFNGFGYMCRVPVQNEDGSLRVRRQVHFLTDEQFTTKPLDGLDAIEVPAFKAWAEKFRNYSKKVADARAKGASPATTTDGNGVSPAAPLAEAAAEPAQSADKDKKAEAATKAEIATTTTQAA